MFTKDKKTLNKTLYLCLTVSSIVLTSDGYAGSQISRQSRDDDSDNRKTAFRLSTPNANFNAFDTPKERKEKEAAYANFLLAKKACNVFKSEAKKGSFDMFDQEAIKRHNVAIEADLKETEIAFKERKIVTQRNDEIVYKALYEQSRLTR